MGSWTAGVAEVVRVTFQREALPPPAPPGPASAPARSKLSFLLAPEPLPSDLPPLPRRGGRWLAWLLSPESLDP
jgi:hypothetical protein